MIFIHVTIRNIIGHDFVNSQIDMMTLEIQTFNERDVIRRNRLHMLLWSFELMTGSSGHCVSQIINLLLRDMQDDNDWNRLRQTLGILWTGYI